jgi:high-affinity nickel-transport protein
MRGTTAASICNEHAGNLGARLTCIFGLLVAGNVAAWAWALISFRGSAVLLGTASLAYSFALRHAFDADHIAAIDNVTRKLVQERQRPVAVGLYFALGHSTVVVALTMLIALASTALADRDSALRSIGGVIGTGISALFLLGIGAANFLILIQLYRAFRAIERGGPFVTEDLDRLFTRRGLLGRIFRRLFRLVQRGWHMYPLGLLFGLGFDTATEVGLLGITASQASRGLSLWSILIFPALFTACMSLIDTIDGVVMLGAYGWAAVKPIRKLHYNLTITFVTVVAALVIGGVEALGLMGDKLQLEGRFWDAIGMVNDHFDELGCAMVVLFTLSWFVSSLIYRAKGYDSLGAQS